MKKKRITSLIIEDVSDSLMTTYEETSHQLIITRNRSISHTIYNGMSIQAVRTFEYKVGKDDIEDFSIN